MVAKVLTLEFKMIINEQIQFLLKCMVCGSGVGSAVSGQPILGTVYFVTLVRKPYNIIVKS